MPDAAPKAHKLTIYSLWSNAAAQPSFRSLYQLRALLQWRGTPATLVAVSSREACSLGLSPLSLSDMWVPSLITCSPAEKLIPFLSSLLHCLLLSMDSQCPQSDNQSKGPLFILLKHLHPLNILILKNSISGPAELP